MNVVNETMYVLTGRWITDSLWIAQGQFGSEGQPASVYFDYTEVIRREQACGDVIGFYHTHPSFPAYTSQTDIETMNAWVDIIGKDLLCLIDGVDGLKTFYWKGDGKFVFGESFKDGDIFIGKV